MKKITITLMLMLGVGFTSFGQSLKQVQFNHTPTSSRSGVVAHPVTNQVLLKNGGAPAVNVAFTDDFSLPNDTDGLKARGYLPYYRGAGPQGTTGAWFQGNSANWGDFNNGSSEYVCSNYQSVTGTNDIDNWLVLPSLDVAIGDVISFYSQSPLNSTYPDSIRVMYSDAGDSIPEATTWVELGRFKVNTTGAWIQESFSAPTAGTTARFAIRYAVEAGGPTGLNSDLIGIDQLDVFTPAAVDVLVLNIDPINAEYTQVPLQQASGLLLSGTVKNNGGTATTGGTALFEVISTTTTSIVFSQSVALPNLAIAATSTVNTTNVFTPTIADTYKVRLTLSLSGDGNAGNDILESTETQLTDSTYARDNDVNSGSLGIGAGPSSDGIVGQNFNINVPTSLTSVSFYMTSSFDPNPSGTPIWCSIYSQTAGSEPSAVIATTDTVVVMPGSIAAPGQWFTLHVSGTPAALASGLYFVGVHEYDSTLTLGTTTDIATPTAVWVSWNSIPSPPAVNGWATAADFGFNIAYQLRMNFGDVSSGISDYEIADGISIYPNPSSGIIHISNKNAKVTDYKVRVLNSLGQEVHSANYSALTNATIDLSSQPAGVYHVQLNNGTGTFNKTITISNN